MMSHFFQLDGVSLISWINKLTGSRTASSTVNTHSVIPNLQHDVGVSSLIGCVCLIHLDISNGALLTYEVIRYSCFKTCMNSESFPVLL